MLRIRGKMQDENICEIIYSKYAYFTAPAYIYLYILYLKNVQFLFIFQIRTIYNYLYLSRGMTATGHNTCIYAISNIIARPEFMLDFYFMM